MTLRSLIHNAGQYRQRVVWYSRRRAIGSGADFSETGHGRPLRRRLVCHMAWHGRAMSQISARHVHDQAPPSPLACTRRGRPATRLPPPCAAGLPSMSWQSAEATLHRVRPLEVEAWLDAKPEELHLQLHTTSARVGYGKSRRVPDSPSSRGCVFSAFCNLEIHFVLLVASLTHNRRTDAVAKRADDRGLKKRKKKTLREHRSSFCVFFFLDFLHRRSDAASQRRPRRKRVVRSSSPAGSADMDGGGFRVEGAGAASLIVWPSQPGSV